MLRTGSFLAMFAVLDGEWLIMLQENRRRSFRWVCVHFDEQCRLNWLVGELLNFAGRRKLLTAGVAAAPESL